MKRTVAFFIAIIFIFSFGVSAHADDPSYDGISFDNYSGVYYPRVKQGNAVYYMSEPLSAPPRTVEAWVYLTNTLDKSGVLFSNKDDSKDNYISLETDQNGAVIYTNSGFKAHFTKALLPAGRWVHLAVTASEGTGTVTCYINGKAAEHTDGFLGTDKTALINVFTVGGDSEYQNYPPFCGRVRKLTVYDYALSAKEVSKSYRRGADTDGAGVIASYTLRADSEGRDIEDDSKNGNTLIYSKMWLTEQEVAKTRTDSEREYSIALIGDTQYMSEFYPTGLMSMYGWIANNRQKYNIKCVLGLGDMTNRDTEYEWENIRAAMSLIDGIPYSVIRGNHDIKGYTATANNVYHLARSGVDTKLGQSTGGVGFDRVFNKTAYTSGLGGSYPEGSVANSWRLLDTGNVGWLILCLDYLAGSDVLEWASGVIAAHPDRQVIITTHAYLDRNGKRLDYAEYIWQELVSRHKNIKLVISGHINSGRIITSKENGVTQILVDMQSCDNRFRGAGFVTLLHFNKDGTRCEVECISTASESAGMYYRSINQFEIEV